MKKLMLVVFFLSLGLIHAKPRNMDLLEGVNMLGLESKTLIVENPEKDISEDFYTGYGFRYLFMPGKTYLHFGIMKPTSKVESSTAIKDVFYYGMGGDYYPRYLTLRGRKFFNLYVGLELDGMLTVSDDDTGHYFRGEPKIGLELINTKYILIDTSVGYSVPINKDLNYNFRGIMPNISFNFIF